MSEPPTKYIMSNIRRGTSVAELIATDFGPPAELLHHPTLEDSRLDDEDSITTLEFTAVPDWLQRLGRGYFHYKTALGTVWGGVDMACDSSGKTPFMRAVIHGDVLLAEMLAEFAVTNLNATDENGFTALHWACSEGLLDMTEFLLTLPGLDSGLLCHKGSTAFDIAYERSETDEALPALFYKSTFTMEKHDPQGALLRLVTMTEPRDDLKEFPGEFLFDPAAGGNVPLVKALMKRGIGLTATNEQHETALHLAAKHGHSGVASALVGKKSRGKEIDIHAVADDNMMALHYAAKTASPETVRVLVRGGAKLEAVSQGGKTALHHAAEQASAKTVRELVDLGANKEAKRHDGQTALHIAAQLPTAETASVLIELKANPYTEDNDGKTPLDLAAGNSNEHMQQVCFQSR